MPRTSPPPAPVAAASHRPPVSAGALREDEPARTTLSGFAPGTSFPGVATSADAKLARESGGISVAWPPPGPNRRFQLSRGGRRRLVHALLVLGAGLVFLLLSWHCWRQPPPPADNAAFDDDGSLHVCDLGFKRLGLIGCVLVACFLCCPCLAIGDERPLYAWVPWFQELRQTQVGNDLVL